MEKRSDKGGCLLEIWIRFYATYFRKKFDLKLLYSVSVFHITLVSNFITEIRNQERMNIFSILYMFIEPKLQLQLQLLKRETKSTNRE